MGHKHKHDNEANRDDYGSDNGVGYLDDVGNEFQRDKLKWSKRGTGSNYPEHAIDSAGAPERIEHFITGKELKSRFLWGIPLVNPFNPKEKITAKDLEDYIKRGCAQFERDAQVEVAPIIRSHRLPFDPNMYHQFIYCEIPNKPVNKVLELSIRSASYRDTPQEHDRYPQGAEIYKIPNQWIEMGNALRGILNVNPINPAFSAVGITTSVAASGATILQFIGQQGWVPAYWTAIVVHGFCSEEGNVPVIVNEAVGTRAAMMLLDNLIPLYKIASQSLQMDGLGQSVSDMSYKLLTDKRVQLEKDYLQQVKKIKMLTANTMFTSNV